MKCPHCPIKKECSVWALKQPDEKGNLHKICPIVWVIAEHIKALPTEKEYLSKLSGRSGVFIPPRQADVRSGVRT